MIGGQGGHNHLASLAADIREAHAKVASGALAIAEPAPGAGQMLAEAKAVLPHGEWTAWLSVNTGLSARTARRYMQLASSGLKAATVADLGVRGAGTKLARSRIPRPAVGQFAWGITDGEITLAHYERMCVAIAEAGAVDEVKDIRDKALALEGYSRQAKNTELEAVVVRIRIRAERRAERRAGELLRDMDRAKPGQPKKNGNAALPFFEGVADNQALSEMADGDEAPPPTLAQLGISKPQSSRWQKLADVPFERFERALAKTEKKVSTTGIINLSASVVGENHRAGGTSENEWYTPAEYVGAAREFLGGVDLDPASSALANETVQAAMFHSQEDDGLSQEWVGRVWLNPPYAQPWIARFMEKLVLEADAGRVTSAIALTHNYTDTAWFQNTARASAAICFTRGRIGFVNPEGVKAAPTQGQAFFYFGSDPAGFASAFGRFGIVMVKP